MSSLRTMAIWSDGTWCFLSDLQEFGFMSDDFQLLTFDESIDNPEDLAVFKNKNFTWEN